MELSLERGRSRPDDDQPERTVHTVSSLVQLVSRRIERAYPQVWVQGEVSNLRRPSSGHLYFTLKDARAQLPVVVFRSTRQRLKFDIEAGQRLRLRGRLTIYEVQGRFQLNADRAEPDGLGELQLALEQLKRKLAAEGLFDERRKRALPLLPRRVVLVTSRSGAAVRDMLRVLATRHPVHITLCPTPVQGREAPFEICAALRRADALGANIVIVGRGGGSVEDLWAFNNEQLVRTIARMSTPVISAVGHETDVTLADLVADRRAATPSAAAELAVPSTAALQERLARCRAQLLRAVENQLGRSALSLERLRRKLGSPRGAIDRQRMRLDDTLQRMQDALRRALSGGRRELAGLQQQLERRWAARLAADRRRIGLLQRRLAEQHPAARLARDRASLQQLDQRSIAATRRALALARSRLGQVAARMEALSPVAVLARGYSVALDEQGRALHDAAAVQPGERIMVRLERGELDCRVEERREAAETSLTGDPRAPYQ